jgi:hypothetical protein
VANIGFGGRSNRHLFDKTLRLSSRINYPHTCAPLLITFLAFFFFFSNEDEDA